jgi:hypothetical protein
VRAHEAGLSKGVTGCPVGEVVGIRMRKTGSLSEDGVVVVGTVGLREYEPRLCNQASLWRHWSCAAADPSEES